MKKPGVGSLVAVLVVIATGAIIPVLQVVQPRLSQDTRTATVTDVHDATVKRASRRGKAVDFELPDGTTGTVHLTRRADYPDPGDEIAVYHDDDRERWATPEKYSWGQALIGVAVFGFGIVLLIGWFVLRRRAADPPPEPVSDEEFYAQVEQHLAEKRRRGEGSPPA